MKRVVLIQSLTNVVQLASARNSVLNNRELATTHKGRDINMNLVGPHSYSFVTKGDLRDVLVADYAPSASSLNQRETYDRTAVADGLDSEERNKIDDRNKESNAWITDFALSEQTALETNITLDSRINDYRELQPWAKTIPTLFDMFNMDLKKAVPMNYEEGEEKADSRKVLLIPLNSES